MPRKNCDLPIRYAVPKTLEAKYSHLRVRATGTRRKGGIAKGSPRSPQYGQGRTRAIPTLDQVLKQNDLPPVAPILRGEFNMLARKRLDTFYQELQTPSRVLKAVSKTDR